jgi:DNA repair exonuclease SbcCD nuclease subunit
VKVAILGDTHFGMRGDSPAFHEYFRRFYEEVFFPTLEKEGIKYVIQLGDLFDRRKFINFKSLALSREYFFDRFGEITLYALVGNHDIFYKNTLAVNSLDLLLGEYVKAGSIVTVAQPTWLGHHGVQIDLIPWICQENCEDAWEFIRRSKSSICCGHFEIKEYVESDPDVLKLQRKKMIYDEKVDLCESILKELNSRTYQMRDYIRWIELTMGS